MLVRLAHADTGFDTPPYTEIELDEFIRINVEAEDMSPDDAEAFEAECREGLSDTGYVRFGGGAAGRSVISTPEAWDLARDWVAG